MSGENQRLGTPDDRATIDVAALQAELAEAKRIGTWLYGHAPAGLRRHLGVVSEWPWLLDAPGTEDRPVPPPPPQDDPERDQAVLRTFAELQATGEDDYVAAEYIADVLHLRSAQFDAAVGNLIGQGLVEGGKTFQRTFVEHVAPAGMTAAGVITTSDGEGAEPP